MDNLILQAMIVAQEERVKEFFWARVSSLAECRETILQNGPFSPEHEAASARHNENDKLYKEAKATLEMLWEKVDAVA